MRAISLQSTEHERLAALHQYALLDTPPDADLDRITAMAARLFGVPIAFVGLVDHDRVWYKSRYGLDVPQVERLPGLCASAILTDVVYHIADTASAPRTRTHPLVRGTPWLRAYMAVPLRTADGYNLGTFGLMDTRPHHFTADEQTTLRDIAAIVMDHIEKRHAVRELMQIGTTLTNVIQELPTTTGPYFATTLLQQLTTALKVDFAFIGEFLPNAPHHVRISAGNTSGRIVDQFEYDLALSPCRDTREHQRWFFPKGVQQQFPHDPLLYRLKIEGYAAVLLQDSAQHPMGLLVIMHQQPLQQIQLVRLVLQIFALRIASEWERRLAATALAESERKYQLLMEQATDGILISDNQGSYIDANAKACDLLGYTREELLRLTIRDLIADSETVNITACLETLADGAAVRCERSLQHKDGSILIVEISARMLENSRIQAIIRDITERKQTEEQLLHHAFHDMLTGLPNRALFIDRLEQAIYRSKRRKDYMFAILFLDLDRFKIINDSLGHTIGDQLLVAMARRLELCLRPGDTIARLGGDEFTILLDDIKDFANANFVAERIQKAVSLPFDMEGHEVFTTVSIGIAVSATGYDRPDEVLRDADIAMYRAKALGKARYEVFDINMHARFVSLLRLETDLRRALERQEFRVYYQPIVSLETGHITGFEALLRWQHPRRGLILPGEFIPVAEETGLIITMDRWVLREAYRQMRIWHKQLDIKTPLSVSVNLSSKQFSQPDLIEHIDQTLREQDGEAHHLKLELTESVVMENAEVTAAMLADLRALNVRVSIDDFGTGYSSLSYLQRFPIDTLKIDRSFVKGIGVNGDNIEIVQAITALAHSLGMDVIAEGIETAEQLARLRALACEYGQGYYFARPIDSEAAYALLAARPRW